MPSWSPSEPPIDDPPAAPPAPAAVVEKARRLLEELFADAPDGDVPDLTEQ